MQEVTMKEECIPWLHFNIDKFQSLLRFFNPFKIGAGLLSCDAMGESAEFVRTFDHLQASVFAVGWRECRKRGEHVRVQKAVVVPVAVVLMPFPRAANTRIFLHKL